jgi:hypothetical protein
VQISLPHAHDVEIVGFVVSPAHRYDGRPGETVPEQSGDRPELIELRGGVGILGDRYAGRAAHRDAAVTVLAAESVEALAAELGSGPLDPLLARRNVVLRGAEVEALRGPGPLPGPAPSLRGVGRRGSFNRALGWTSCSRPEPTVECAGAPVSGAPR